MGGSRLEETLADVRERVDRALERRGGEGQVRIVAVTKGHPPEVARAALRSGLEALGENRIQELEQKVREVGRDAAEWHMVGHLQRNKARAGLPLFDWIHSVDSLRLARALSAEAVRTGLEVRGLLQVNVSGEAGKGGFQPGTVVEALTTIRELAAIEIHGLMTMAPWTDDGRVLRRTFAATRELLSECERQLPGALRGRELSMGMSNDFEIAIEEGATMVRLGTVLFGERERK
jgi:PLP dependent protein